MTEATRKLEFIVSTPAGSLAFAKGKTQNSLDIVIYDADRKSVQWFELSRTDWDKIGRELFTST